MATLIKTIDKAFSNYYTFRINVYEDSYSIPNNTSSVYVVGQLIADGSAYISSSASKEWSCTIDGTKYSGTCTVGISGGQTKSLFTTSKSTIKHNADGKKSINVSATLGIKVTLNGSYVTSVSASGTAALTNIPRNTTIASAPAVTVNGTNKSTVTINSPAVASYTHTVTWSLDGYTSHTETIAAGSTTAQYAIPANWKNSFPNTKSGQCTVTLKTFSGSTQIGSSVSAKVTMNCTGSETPSFSAEVNDANGVADKIGCFVVGKSKLAIKMTAISYQFGAKLKSVTVTMDGVTYTGTSTTVTASSLLKTVGNQSVTVKLTDTRGYTKTVTTSITGYEYTNPSLAISISRYSLVDGSYTKDDEGSYGKVYYRATYSNIGTNAINVRIDYASQTGTDTGTIEMSDATGQTYIPCNTELVYNFTLKITDSLTSATYHKQLSSARTILDILKGGLGLAVGGVATVSKLFDVFWNTRIRGSLKVDKPIYVNYKDGSYELNSGSSWVELCQLPELEDGAYHFDIVLRFPKNSTGTRCIGVLYSDDEGNTKSDLGIGWTDLQLGNNDFYTFCRVSGNTTMTGRRSYIRAFQTSGAKMTVDVKYAYHRIN